MFIFRILAKYYDSSVLSTPQEQKKFEKNLFGKTHKVKFKGTVKRIFK